MSIGLAIGNIGKYTSLHQVASQTVDRIQQAIQRLTLATRANPQQFQDPGVQAEIGKLQAELALWGFLQGLFQQFMDYWKQLLKDILAMIKSISELAQGAR